MSQNSPTHLSKQDTGVGCRYVFVIDDSGLFQPLVRLGQSDVISVVAPGHPELCKNYELIF